MFQTFFENSNRLYTDEDITYFVGYLRMRKELASVNPENAHLKTHLAETSKELASVKAVMGMKCFQQSVENDLLCKELDAVKKQAAATHLDNCDLFIKKRMVSKELESVKKQAAETESENVKHVVDNAKMRGDLAAVKTQLAGAERENAWHWDNHFAMRDDMAAVNTKNAHLKNRLAERAELTERLKDVADLKKQLAIAQISLLFAGISLVVLAVCR